MTAKQERRKRVKYKELRRRVGSVIRNGRASGKEFCNRSMNILKDIAEEASVPIPTVSIDMILELRCCITKFPKVKYDTLSDARFKFNGPAYPCKCGYWHCSRQKINPPKPFTCGGCGLTYVKKSEEQKFCTKGCRKRHNRRKI